MAEFKAAEPSAEVHTDYFNGFDIAFGNADFMLSLKLDNDIIHRFKASYTVAKTLAEKMDYSIKAFEGLVGQPMLTTEVIFQAIQASNAKQAKPTDKAEQPEPKKVT